MTATPNLPSVGRLLLYHPESSKRATPPARPSNTPPARPQLRPFLPILINRRLAIESREIETGPFLATLTSRAVGPTESTSPFTLEPSFKDDHILSSDGSVKLVPFEAH